VSGNTTPAAMTREEEASMRRDSVRCDSVRSSGLAGWMTILFSLGTGLALGAQPASSTGPAAAKRLVRVPAAFVENRGQWPAPVRFRIDRPRMTVWLHEQGWTFTLRPPTGPGRAAVRMTFETRGDDRAVRLQGEDRVPGIRNYFLGADRLAWRSGVSAFGRVRFVEPVEGIDVVVRERNGFLEYDLEVTPHADPEAMVIRCEGLERLTLAEDGALRMETAAGVVRQTVPRTWETTEDGRRRALACRFVLFGPDRYGFRVEGRRADRPLTIDPGLTYSTYLGGTGSDSAAAVDVDPTGAVIVAGGTDSSDFPVTPGAYQTQFKGAMGVTDAFVVRLDPAGKLVWATYFGGAFTDLARGVKVDPNGVVTITGQTFSPDLPVTPGVVQGKSGGQADAFVARLTADGAKLVYSTYLGGSQTDQGNALALHRDGSVTVTGYAISTDFPITPNAFQKVQKGSYNVFVSRLNATATTLVFSTYLGGTKYDIGRAVGVDGAGRTAVAGQTGSPDFPVTPGAFQTQYAGPVGFGTDAFIAVLDHTGSKLFYSTFAGGSAFDSVGGVHFDPTGTVTAAGYTLSADFPVTAGAYQTVFGGGNQFRGDGFVIRLDGSGSTAWYSTYLGGPGPDDAMGVSVNSAGVATVVGSAGNGFPVTPGAWQTSFKGPSAGTDGFLARLGPKGSTLHYSTYLGGSMDDSIAAVTVDAQEDAAAAGMTASFDFPTTPGAPQSSLTGRAAATVVRLDMLPAGTLRYGTTTPACGQPIVIGVNRMPLSPEPGFAFTCVGAPPLTVGYLILGLGQVAGGFPVLGVTLYPSPASPHIVYPAATDGAGYTETKLPIPAGLRGITFYTQFLWANTRQCGVLGTYIASNALRVTIH